jgi:hypothetical protein
MLRSVAITRATRRSIPEDTNLHSHRRENLQSRNWREPYTPRRNEYTINAYALTISFRKNFLFQGQIIWRSHSMVL